MNRIQHYFNQLPPKKALIPYLVAGDPSAQATVSVMHDMVTAGADIIELGIPFSDPVADGEINQQAMQRALSNGMSVAGVLDIVANFRQSNTKTPVVLMGYLNPIEIMGYAKFAKRAQQSGVDGVLVVDCPPEEAQDLQAQLRQQAIDMIYLLAPTTQDARLRQICQQASGYLYYVSMKGVTGTKTIDVVPVAKHLACIREITDLPIAVGFGVKTAEAAKAVANIADGVVVGSSLVDLNGKGQTQDMLALVQTMAAQCHA